MDRTTWLLAMCMLLTNDTVEVVADEGQLYRRTQFRGPQKGMWMPLSDSKAKDWLDMKPQTRYAIGVAQSAGAASFTALYKY